jgi:hypothetical protein
MLKRGRVRSLAEISMAVAPLFNVSSFRRGVGHHTDSHIKNGPQKIAGSDLPPAVVPSFKLGWDSSQARDPGGA